MMDSQCELFIRKGRDPRNVSQFIMDEVDRSMPSLAWGEPDPLDVELDNRDGRRDDFRPLVLGAPSWPDDVTLLEARLFWDSTALHVAMLESGGCGWTRIEEMNGAPDQTAGAMNLIRSTKPVHTRRDMTRFGLQGLESFPGLTAVEYRERGRLVAWRLTIEAGELTHG